MLNPRPWGRYRSGDVKRTWDLVVLGGGSAGLVASLTAAGLGARVALIEADRPGGDCLYTGCVPSKSLIASARLAHDIRHAGGLGLEPFEPRFDFARVMERIGSVIDAAGEHDSPEYLGSQGVEVVQGHGRFAAPGVVSVDGRELRFRAALIATGSRPAVPPIAGIDSADVLTNETVFELRELPQRLAVLGGGPVGVELAQAFGRLGSRVELVEMAGELLPREDPEASRLIALQLADEGVQVHTQTRATGVPGPCRLSAEGPAGTIELGFDRLLVAAGRRPVVDDLGLDTVGVETTAEGWIRVDRFLRTTGDRIFAAGDAVGELFFTHVAGYHALVAMANALFRARRKVDHSAIPSVTFTDPEVARVGLTEQQARERLGHEPLVFRHDYARSDRALTASATQGFAKLIADRRGRLVGATVVGEAAGESIAEVARLVRDGGKVAELSQTVHAYPTFTEAPARAADDWWRHKYLNPRGRRRLRPLLALLRALDRPRG